MWMHRVINTFPSTTILAESVRELLSRRAAVSLLLAPKPHADDGALAIRRPRQRRLPAMSRRLLIAIRK